MNEKFESQKERLLSIKQEISLLYQQINYLLRNERPLELLDLDVLMNRTHTLYDQLCAINVGDESLEEDLPFDAEAFSGLFGSMMQEEPEEVPQEEPQVEQEPEEEIVIEKNPIVVETVEQPTVMESVEEPVVEVKEEPVAEEPVVAQPELEPEDKPLGDEYGVFIRFEESPLREEQPVEEQPIKETEGKVVHVMEEIPEEEIPERDRVYGEDLVKDNPLEMPEMEDEPVEKETFEYEKPATDGLFGFFEKDDTGFELSTGETLGEKMMGEDRSLAAKLQQNPVRDLKSVIGINDKFLFVNELFGGSMEKYNKSIENLNDLKTLNGAMIYLNELKIELQWNSSNEAYMKLKDLVTRKFE